MRLPAPDNLDDGAGLDVPVQDDAEAQKARLCMIPQVLVERRAVRCIAVRASHRSHAKRLVLPQRPTAAALLRRGGDG